jgi:hypothetical protein
VTDQTGYLGDRSVDASYRKPTLWATQSRQREAHAAGLARGRAFRAHRLAELLQYAQTHRASAFAGRDALGATPLLRIGYGELATLPRVSELPSQTRNLLARLPAVLAVDLAPQLLLVERGLCPGPHAGSAPVASSQSRTPTPRCQ